jgi:sterol 3beta-glucosyltransferase
VGLAPIRAKSLAEHAFSLGVPHVHLFSQTIVRRPSDWPPWASIAGFCFLDSESYEPPSDLVRFLESGPPPVYIGFGSMTGTRPKEVSEIAIRAVERAGTRAVIVSGWAE